MKITTLLLAGLLLAGVSHAQTFSAVYSGPSVVVAPNVYISDSVLKGPTNQDVNNNAIIITNLSASAINIDVIRLENNMPVGWSTAVCLDICYAPTVDTASVSIPKGGSQYILLHFYTFSAMDTIGSVKMKIQNDNNPSEYTVLDYYVGSDSALTGIAENNVGPINLEAFPNPFASTATINLINYRVIHGNAPLDFTMYDLLGNSVFSKSRITGDEIVVNRNGLPSGIYFYKLMNGSKEAAFGRLSVQ